MRIGIYISTTDNSIRTKYIVYFKTLKQGPIEPGYNVHAKANGLIDQNELKVAWQWPAAEGRCPDTALAKPIPGRCPSRIAFGQSPLNPVVVAQDLLSKSLDHVQVLKSIQILLWISIKRHEASLFEITLIPGIGARLVVWYGSLLQ